MKPLSILASCLLISIVISSCNADTSYVVWPTATSCLAMSGGTKFNVSGHLLFVPFAVELVGMGNISCITLVNNPPDWTIGCVAPSGRYAVYVDLKLYIYDGWSGGTYVTSQANTFVYTVGQVTSVYPTGLAYNGGTLLTLTGTCFGNNSALFRYFSIGGGGPVTYASSWTSISETQIVIPVGAVGSGTRETLQDIYLAFDVYAYYRYNAQVQFIQPVITSATDVSINGGQITISGARFGTDKTFYRYAYFAYGTTGTGFLVIPSDAAWVSISDTRLVFNIPSCCENSISSAAFYLAYDTTAYVQSNVLNWVYPTLTGLTGYISQDIPDVTHSGTTSYFGANLAGHNFGLAGTSFYTFISMESENTWSPNVRVVDQNNIQFWWEITDSNYLYANPQPNHPHYNVRLYLHWGSAAYGWVDGVTFSY